MLVSVRLQLARFTGTYAGWLLAALGLAALAWWLRAPLHALPLERDEGAYAIIATRLLAGDVLYRELFDHKPPLVHLIYTLAVRVPGDPVVAVRRLATLYLLATGAALLVLARRLYGPLAALVALATLLAYGSSWRFQGLSFNSEAVLLLPATLACHCAVSALLRGQVQPLFWAGLGVGLAALAKPVGLALLGPLLLSPLLVRWPWRRVLAGMALSTLGVTLPLALFLLSMWRQHALGAAYTALVSYNQLYAAESVAQGWTPMQLWPIWAPMLALVVPALLSLLVVVLGTPAPPPAWRAAHGLTALWGLALLATALLSLRPYPHYYLVTVPFLSLWVGAGIAWLARRLALGRPWLVLAAAGLASVTLVTPVYVELAPLRRLEPLAQISTLYAWEGVHFFAPAAAVATYVAARVPPEQAIFVWAAEPQIYYLAARQPASRFVYDYPIDRLPGARDELLASLRRAPPPLIITYYGVRPPGSHPFLEEAGYRLTVTIGGFEIFERMRE